MMSAAWLLYEFSPNGELCWIVWHDICYLPCSEAWGRWINVGGRNWTC
jgi:hypothetical protein